MNKTKLRRGIGYMGRVFQYGTAVGTGGASLRTRGPVEIQEDHTRKLNKTPEFKRAGKKRQRLDDFQMAHD